MLRKVQPQNNSFSSTFDINAPNHKTGNSEESYNTTIMFTEAYVHPFVATPDASTVYYSDE